MNLTIPSYFSYDKAEINKLLSRFNITNPKEIEVFNNLVIPRAIKIPYKDAIEIAHLQENEPLFKSIITKLEEETQYIILRNKITTHILEPDYIRFCDENSVEFFCEYITELLLKAKINDREPLTFKSELEKHIDIPQGVLSECKSESLQEFYADPAKTPDIVFALETYKDTFLFTPASISSLWSTCAERMKQIFENNIILHVVAKHLNTSITSIKEKIENNEIAIWNDFISTLFKELDPLSQNQQIKNYPDFLQLIIILEYLLKPKIIQLENVQSMEKKIEEHSKNVIKTIKKFPSGVSSAQFNQILQREIQTLNIKGSTTKVLDNFNKKYVTIANDATAEKKIKKIVKIENYHIYTELLGNYISEKYFTLEEKLKEHFVNNFQKYLLKKLPHSEITFFDEDLFEISVRQKVREYEELYYRILRAPILIASIIIHFDKNMKKIESLSGEHSDSVTKRLSAFFDLRTQSLLKWQEIFNLRVTTLSNEAYRRLNVWHKIILMFTGRYKNTQTKLRRITSIRSTIK